MSKTFLCRCEDVPLVEVEEALAAGHDDLESLRRYTAVGTGPCQGKACMAPLIRLLAKHHDVDPSAIGLHTMRPPLVPIDLGHLADLDESAVERLLEEPGLGIGEAHITAALERNVGHGTLALPATDGDPEDPTLIEFKQRPVRGVVDDETYRSWASKERRRRR